MFVNPVPNIDKTSCKQYRSAAGLGLMRNFSFTMVFFDFDVFYFEQGYLMIATIKVLK